MDIFDDIEGKNAQTWDEELPGMKPAKTAANTASSARQHGNNGRPVSSQPVPAAMTEIRQPIINERLRQKDRIPPDHHCRQKPGRSRKDQVVKKVEWSKQYAVNTKRKQDYLDKEAKKAAKGMEFLGFPTIDNLPAEGYYYCPDINIDPGNFLFENLELFDDVRMDCEVYIDFVEALSCIRLRSKSRNNIEDGILSIKAKIQHIRADAASHAPIYIVEPPAVCAMKSEVTPIFQELPSVGKQRTITKMLLAGSTLDAKQRVAWEVERQAIIKHNKDRFTGHMTKALVDLVSLNETKKMRSNLGKIHLLRYRKDIEQGYPFQRFSNMMEDARTQGKFQTVIPGASTASSILDSFSTATTLFEPIDPLTSDLVNVKPKHSLVIIAHSPSKQSVRIEAEVEALQRPTLGSGRRSVNWQIGAIKYYHHGHVAQKTRLTIGSLSVESQYDACLEITTEEVMPQPPKVFQKLVEGSISGTSTFTTQNSKMDYPALKLSAAWGIVVEDIVVKSALRYRFKDTSYIAELIVHHGWKSSTRQEPEISCGVSLYHKDWDIIMAADGGVENPTALSMELLFPNEQCPDDGISSFLNHVQTLQRFISPAMTGLSVHVNT